MNKSKQNRFPNVHIHQRADSINSSTANRRKLIKFSTEPNSRLTFRASHNYELSSKQQIQRQ